MALDHASAMIGRVHFSEIWGVPFSGYPSFGWWFTRFISHLCAPGFFFLMGMSIFLFAHKSLNTHLSLKRIHRYFLKRGGLILLLMIFIEFPAWGLSMLFRAENGIVNSSSLSVIPGSLPAGAFAFPSTVLYGLGACMMICGFLWRLKAWQLLSVTIACFGLSWWAITSSLPTEMFSPIEHLFMIPGMSPGVMVIYPIIPWLGITTFGIFWAQLLISQPKFIYPLSLITGLSMIGLFTGLRFLDMGNYNMSEHNSWIGFFTLVKYPPSITFALITCGINLILFYIFSKISVHRWLEPLQVFGQTAMFFYLLHLYLYAIIGAAIPEGCSIELMYLLWIMGLVLLYPLCRRYISFKRSKPKDSLWRMI
jgi:uncharacterized membrane protein